MILDTHKTPEGGFCEPGFNLWDGDELWTSFRLIYRSTNTNWYFRIRGSLMPESASIPKYVFSWD